MSATAEFNDALLAADGPTLTTDSHRCTDCLWTLFGGLWGGAWCVNPECPEYRVDTIADYVAEGVVSSPNAQDNDDESETR